MRTLTAEPQAPSKVGIFCTIAAILCLGLAVFVSWQYLWGLLIFGAILNASEPHDRELAEKKLKQSVNFSAAFRFDSPALGGKSLLVDTSASRLAVIQGTIVRQYPFSDILAVEVDRNESTVHKTNRGNQVARAAVGGVLLGGAGLLVGGLTASKRSESRVSKLSLKLITKDVAHPIEEIVFFSAMGGMDENGWVVRQAAGQLDHWYARMRGIIAKSENSDSLT